jgi:hypothetical protein
VIDGWIVFFLLVAAALIISLVLEVRRSRQRRRAEEEAHTPHPQSPPFTIRWPDRRPIDQDEEGW